MSITFREIVIVLYGKKGTCSLVKIRNDRASLPDNIITYVVTRSLRSSQ